MKTTAICTLLAGSLLFSGCVIEERHHGHRRYISYSDTDPYYRVYYHGPAGRVYYRQHYYEDVPEFRTRISTRRYYYTPPASRAAIEFGF